MDDALRAMALRIADGTWRKVQASHQRSFDVDDLRQEAVVAAWLWWREHPDCMETDESAGLAYTVVSRDLVDAMRRLQPIGRRSKGEAYRQSARSLDEPVQHRGAGGSRGSAGNPVPVTLADTLTDESADDALHAVEVAHDVRLAFQQHRGPAGQDADRATPAAVAWLNLHGVALADIGAHYGFTESRACQLRTAFIDATARRWAEPAGGAERSAA